MSALKMIVITAHPDDEISSAGTIAKFTQAGHEAVLVVATNGDKGTHDRTITPKRISNIRQQEMEEAAAVLGIRKVIWLGYSDGTLEVSQSLKERVFRTIRQERADILLTFDPWKRWDLHSDHRTIGLAATEAAYLANGCWYYPEHLAEGIEPHETREIYLFSSDEPNYQVDVQATFDLKMRAAGCHRSQGLQYETFAEKYLAWMNSMGKKKEDLQQETFRKLHQSDLLL